MGKGNGVSTHSPDQQMDDTNLENYEANYEQNGSELRIAHNQEDFLNGEQYILTMKDQPVLLGDDINEDEEEMVNVDLNNIQKHKAFLKAKAKISKGGLGMNTAECNDYGEVKRPRILDKYDIEEEEKEGMVLNLRNHSVKRKNKNFTEEKFDGGERNEMITKKIFKSDFLIDEGDSINFGVDGKKPQKLKKRNLKKSRKILASLEELLDEAPDNDEDLKTKEEREKEFKQSEIKNLEIQAQKQNNYEKAVLKANIKARRVFNQDEAEEDEDYILIQKNIEKQRKNLEAKQNESHSSNKTKKAEEILLSILNQAGEEQINKHVNDTFQIPEMKPPNKSKLLFNKYLEVKEITDVFDLSKSNIQTEKDRQSLEDILKSDVSLGFSNTKSGMTSVVNIALPSQKLLSRVNGLSSVIQSKQSMEEIEKEEEKVRNEIMTKEITKEDIKVAEALEEPIVGKGVARVLQVFRMRKMLGQKSDFVGRMKDNKIQRDFEEEGKDEDGIHIMRTDKYGNLMSRKQAFRELCYSFHNKKPSQRKQERMQSRLLKAQKASNLISGQDSFFAKALEKEQKKKKQAHMVIDSKPKTKIQL